VIDINVKVTSIKTLKKKTWTKHGRMDQWILIQVNPWVAKTAKTDMAIQGYTRSKDWS
jgi:hypothetical protein